MSIAIVYMDQQLRLTNKCDHQTHVFIIIIIGNGDEVQCFSCQLRLRNWPRNYHGADPSEEHAKWQPHCRYLRSTESRDFIEMVVKKYQPAEVINNFIQSEWY